MALDKCCACDERVHVVLFSGKPYCTECFEACVRPLPAPHRGDNISKLRETDVDEEPDESSDTSD